MTDIVTAVSKAIWMADSHNSAWGEGDREYYDGLARAAIDALGLTEETATIPTAVGRVEHTQPCELPEGMIGGEDMHTCGYRRGHFEFHPSTRLVSPWKRTETAHV